MGVSPNSVVQSESFIGHGGDSMAALRFSAACKRRGVLIAADTVLSSPSIGSFLQHCQPSTITKTSNEPNSQGTKTKCYTTSIEKLRLVFTETEELNHCTSTTDEIADLSDTQISLIQGSMETAGANIVHYYQTYHPDKIPGIKAAWMEVINIEPIFHTIYQHPENGSPMATKVHWREFATTQYPVYRNAIDSADMEVQPWEDTVDLELNLDVRFTVINYNAASWTDSQSTLIWSVHHALIDGWSASLVLDKVQSAVSGQLVQPGPSYLNICKALNELKLSRKDEGDAFWAEQHEKLVAGSEDLLLPDASVNTTNKMDRDLQEEIRIELKHYYETLREAARICGATPASIYYAAWALCLSIYMNSNNVVIGAVVSGRNLALPGLVDTVGPLMKTLPLQIDIHWEATASEFVRDVFNRVRRLSQYSWTTPDNGFTQLRWPLLAMQPDAQRLTDGCTGLHRNNSEANSLSFSRQTTNLPLSAIVSDDGDVKIQFSRRRYSRSHMGTLADIFKGVLISLCQSKTTVSACAAEIYSTVSFTTLRSLGNCNSFATTRQSIEDDLVTLFERAATTNPCAVAIERGEEKITYAELNRCSGLVARELTAFIAPEEVVAVHADGSVNWLISIYSILRAGGTYCPLDKAYPQPYRDSLFNSSTAKCFLATTEDSLSVKPRTASRVIDVNAILSEAHPKLTCTIAPRNCPRPWERAYICFTSGSTGRPKGVVCTHRGLVAFQRDFEVRLRATVGTRVAQVMSMAFDGSIHELFSTISYGGTLVLRQEGETFAHLKTCDSVILTPSIASVLSPEEFPCLKTVYLVGEAVPQAVCDKWATRKVLYNMYGPTETTCGATIKRLHAKQPVTIGRPNPSTRLYILDHRRQMAPAGRVGEIYLAGVQVAQCYIGRPDLTAERFLPDTICTGLGEFMYRTGDRGYWDDNGDVVFLGRVDRQTKLRGFRVDLEDLEARILRGCQGAEVVAITRTGDDLACMIQIPCGDLVTIRADIRRILPAFAVPRYVSITRKLPMTSTGKVDYKAVANINEPLPEENETLETGTEVILAAAWSEVLNLGPRNNNIGPRSNFTQLGGHSLHQIRLAAKLNALIGKPVTVRMIVELPTLRDLAQAIDKVEKGLGSTARRKFHLHQFEPSPMEKEWWQKYQLDRSCSAFNVSYVVRYDPNVASQTKLIGAWNLVLARHDMLRGRYVVHRKHGLQRLLAPCSPRVEKVKAIDVWLELNRPFDLAKGPPVRVTISRNTIVAILSHIVCDYTTLGIVLKEVAAAFQGQALVSPTLPCYQGDMVAPPPSYLTFWSERLEDVKAVRHSYLSNGSDRTSYRGKSTVAQISVPLWHRMQRFVEKCGITLHQLVFAAVTLAVSADDKEMDMTLGMPFMNRHTATDMHAVGLFLEPLPVRITYNNDVPTLNGKQHVILQSIPTSLEGYLSAVQASCQCALSHAIPWHRLMGHLDINAPQQFPNHPLFDCVVSFHDARPPRTSSAEAPAQDNPAMGGPWSQFAPGTGIEPQLVWSEGAKFVLMVECIATDDDALLLRLEYDTACFEGGAAGRIAAVRRIILRALSALVSQDTETQGSFFGLRQELSEAWRSEKACNFAKQAGYEVDTGLLEDREKFFMESLYGFNTY
ncbi:hypothetical protein BJ170DRAFT_671051 [Xylariales sp. AK1849]|nr:hypothetical protein BJ170DRAFT_671051 [Xylariales sp. AK1849]